MIEELINFALNHAQRSLNATYPWHGAVLNVAQASGSARLLLANPGVAQSITGAKLTLAASETGFAGLTLPPGVDPTTPVNGDIWVTATALKYRANSVSETVPRLSSNTFTGIQILPASTGGGAGVRFLPGVAPTSPVNGDFWITATAAYAQIGGATVEFALSTGPGADVSSFNGRTGIVTLLSADVTSALGYTPVNPGAGTNTFSGNLVITGNLTVDGTTVTLNTTNLDVEDKLIHLNKVAGANVAVPTGFSGFLIDRGTISSVLRTQAGLVWDEANQRFTLGLFTNDTTMSSETNLRLASLTATGAMFIGTTTVGNSPTSYLGFSSTNCLYVEAGGNTIINSIGNAQIVIDADNNSTANTFKVRANTSNTSGGIDLLTVTEAGNVTAAGNMFATQHASLGAAGAAGAVIVADSGGKIPVAAVPGVLADTPSTIPLRGTDGTIKADNHPDLGTSAASKSVIVADDDGFVPGTAINPASIPVSDQAIMMAYIA